VSPLNAFAVDHTVEHLVNYAQDAWHSTLTPDVVHECKRRVLDTVACALAGRSTEVGKLACNTALRYSGVEQATLWGSRDRSSVDMAAFANGTLLRVLDLSDMYRNRSGGHPSDVIAPIVSAAESAGASGMSALKAMAIAYDVYCGFCDDIDVNSMGWDQPVYGAVAAALGVSAVMELDAPRMKEALSLSLVPNMALYQTRTGELSAWKGCAAANGSRNAVFAASLARDGYTGPQAPVEGSMGLWRATGRFEWNPGGADGRRAVCRTHLKSFPICYHGQSAAWAALELQRAGVRVPEIEMIEIRTYATAVKLMASDETRWNPQTRETADHSLPYVVALGLLHGEVSDAFFEAQWLRDADILSLMKKVRVSEDGEATRAYPEVVRCRLEVRMKNGTTREAAVDHPKGHDRNPMSDREIEDKVKDLLGGSSGGQRAGKVIDAAWRLDDTEHIGTFVESLASPGY